MLATISGPVVNALILNNFQIYDSAGDEPFLLEIVVYNL